MKTIGVIGLGSIGKRHFDNLADLGCSVAYYDPAKPNGYSMREIIDNTDAAVFATPTSQHHIDLRISCMSGKPTFMEKPVSDRIIVTSDIKRIMMVGYNLRFHSCVKKAKTWMDAGMIGKPLWANFTCAQYNDKPIYRRDGVILNWSHEIDLALNLLGPAVVASSATKLEEGQDVMTDIILAHTGGHRTRIHLDYVTKPERRGFVITGERAGIECDLPSRKIRLWGENPQPWWHDQLGSYDQDYKDEMQAFIDRIDGKETIGCTGVEALRVLEICLKVREEAGL